MQDDTALSSCNITNHHRSEDVVTFTDSSVMFGDLWQE